MDFSSPPFSFARSSFVRLLTRLFDDDGDGDLWQVDVTMNEDK
jgi:hypothetical protein